MKQRAPWLTILVAVLALTGRGSAGWGASSGWQGARHHTSGSLTGDLSLITPQANSYDVDALTFQTSWRLLRITRPRRVSVA